MTPEVEKKRRELFEQKTDVPPGVEWCDKDRFYKGRNFWLAQYGWDAFNAALDAVEIELPDPSCDAQESYMRCVDQSITATGLGLRIKE